MKNSGDSLRIAILTSFLDPIINWYHQMLAYVGMTRLNATIATHFYYPTLKARVKHVNVQNYLVLVLVNFHPGMHCYYHGQKSQ